jgi:hypothetical protein
LNLIAINFNLDYVGKLNVDIDLTNKIQAIQIGSDGVPCYDQTWICALASSAQVKKRRIGIAILDTPKCLGPNASAIEFVILVLCPTDEVN